MKTIKKAAEDSRQFDNGLFPNWSDANIWDEAFKDGVKFAQRWISIEEELPDYDELVLWKTDSEYVFVAEIDHDCDWDTFKRMYELPIFDEELPCKITHWRPIERK